MNLAQLGYSILTGSWRIDRAQVREHATMLSATRASREKMIRAGADRASLMGSADRMQLYAGANPGTARPMPSTLHTPEDYKPAYERIVLIRAARQMVEDFGFFDGIIDDFETFVIGEELKYLPNTGNADADRVIREHLEFRFAEADYSNRQDLTGLAQLAVRGMLTDGECGNIPVDVGDSLRLRLVSGDCIGNPLIGTAIGPNNYNGIIVDEASGAPVLFQLYYRVPKLNAYYFDRDIPADQFWHLAWPFAIQQYHGVSVFKNAIRDAFDIDQILEFAKLNIKWRASQLPTVHTETGRPRGAGVGFWGFGTPGGPGASNPNGTPINAQGIPQPQQIMVDGVSVNYMKLDEQVIDYPHDFPNASMGTSIEEFRRQCCKGAKLPYEFVYRADNGGVVQRFWADKAKATFAKIKHRVRRTMLNPFKNRTLRKDVDSGMLNLDSFPGLAGSLALYRGQWQMGETIVVDYGKENETDIKLIEAGLMSPKDKAAEMNTNLEEVQQEISAHAEWVLAEAKRLGTKLKLDPAFVVAYLEKKFPNPGAGLKADAAETTAPVPGQD